MEYLLFELQPKPPGRKTKVWRVLATRGHVPLGRIVWWGTWRQYTLIANQGTVWSPDCLRRVADFCEAATNARRRERMLS